MQYDANYLTRLLYFLEYKILFRAIFDLSNKIALLILRIMYALYVKKKKTKTEIVSKE